MPKYEDKKLGLTPSSLPGFLQTVARPSSQILMLQIRVRQWPGLDRPGSDTNKIIVTSRFPKYGVWGRDDGQQIITKREISSVSTLDCQQRAG